MKYLILIPFLFLITACEARVSKIQIDTAEELCSKNGGLKSVTVECFFDRVKRAECSDDAVYFKWIPYEGLK